ncbi:MAG: GntP family permease [Thermoprotei archaeon]
MDGWIVLGVLAISIAIMVYLTGKIKVNAFLVLLGIAILTGLASGLGPVKTIQAVMDGFGATLRSIGIVIAIGTIIGYILEKTGGAVSMAEAVLRIVGKKRVPEAMNIIGYIISIPVFCDSGFVIVNPLNHALSKMAGISITVSAIALSTGLYATHTLVPPTPGPIAAAANLGADLGLVIFFGLVVAVPAALSGLFYAKLVGSKIYIEPKVEVGYEKIREEYEKLPPASLAFASLIVPIVLIVLKSVAEFPSKPFGSGLYVDIIRFLGEPVMALFIGMIISFLLVPKFDEKVYGPEGWVGEALKTASIIILITGAGGSFGYVIRQTGIGEFLGSLASGYGGGKLLGLTIAFGIAALLKTAQGSSTVSLLTTSAVMAPFLSTFGLDTVMGRVFTTLAIGAGSMVVSHANDSYFWVVTLFSGMTPTQGYKLQTMATLIEGLAAFITVLILSVVFI